jgi:hypothetical protein
MWITNYQNTYSIGVAALIAAGNLISNNTSLN